MLKYSVLKNHDIKDDQLAAASGDGVICTEIMTYYRKTEGLNDCATVFFKNQTDVSDIKRDVNSNKFVQQVVQADTLFIIGRVLHLIRHQCWLLRCTSKVKKKKSRETSGYITMEQMATCNEDLIRLDMEQL